MNIMNVMNIKWWCIRFITTWLIIGNFLLLETSLDFLSAMSGIKYTNIGDKIGVFNSALAASSAATSTAASTDSSGKRYAGKYTIEKFEWDEKAEQWETFLVFLVSFATFYYGAMLYKSLWQVTKFSLFIYVIASLGSLAAEITYAIMYRNLAAEEIKDITVKNELDRLGQLDVLYTMKESIESVEKGLEVKAYMAIGVSVAYVLCGVLAWLEYFQDQATGGPAKAAADNAASLATEADVQAQEDVTQSQVTAAVGPAAAAGWGTIIASAATGFFVLAAGAVGGAGAAGAFDKDRKTPTEVVSTKGRTDELKNKGSDALRELRNKGQATDDNPFNKLVGESGTMSDGSLNIKEIVNLIMQGLTSLGAIVLAIILIRRALSKTPLKCLPSSDALLFDFCFPGSRSIAFAALAGLNGILAGLYWKKLEKVQDRAGVISVQISRLESLIPYADRGKYLAKYDKKVRNQYRDEQQVQVQALERMERVRKSISSLSKKMLAQSAKNFSFSSLNSEQQADLSSAFDMITNAGPSDKSPGGVGAFSFNQAMAKIRKYKKDIEAQQKKFNDGLVKRGERPIPYDQLEKKMQRDMLDATRKVLNKAGVSDAQITAASAAMADQGSASSGDDAAKKVPDSEKKVNGDTAAATAGQVQAGSDGNTGGGFDFDAGKDAATYAPNEPGKGELVGAAGTETIHELSEFEDSKGIDIHAKKEDIFKVISDRHFKTAYPRFLDKE
ncbi:MAG: hypothetical protein HQK53_01800 [Oligoflexia bacterium]|nr:hypothetical protein [Oligoflexia bacterium]